MDTSSSKDLRNSETDRSRLENKLEPWLYCRL